MEHKSKPRTGEAKQDSANNANAPDDTIVVDANDALLEEVEEEADARTHGRKQP
jgi:hypothetical protein